MNISNYQVKHLVSKIFRMRVGRLVAYNPNRVLICLEFDLRKCHLPLDQGFVLLFMKW